MLVIASKAVVLTRGKRQRSMSMITTRRIIASGALVFSFTRCSFSLKGNALSRAIAKPILVVTVRLLNPAQKRFTSRSTVIETAPT